MSALLPVINPHSCLHKQRGAVLMVMLVLVVVGSAAFLVSALNRSGMKNEADKNTAQILSQAKEALIGYAITYGDNYPNQVFGYLPLPDLGTSRTPLSKEGDAAGSFTGNSTNLSVIGRFPWRKLGLPPIRDGQGECLWYAVSGSFQNINKADVLNWDSIGHFDNYFSNGTSVGTVSTTGANHAQRPVAVIFSAGAVLQGQNRQTSVTDSVDSCGGNYDVRNYLDSYNIDININHIINYFSGSTNNSTGYAYNLTNVANGSQLSAADLAAPKNIIFGDIEANISGNRVKIANDRIVTITTDEIFRPISRRTDFSLQISTLMNDANFVPHLQAIPIMGTKGTDNVNCNNTINALNKNFCNNWKEMLLLTRLPVMSSITIDGAATLACNRVLIFGGQRIPGQTRITITDKSAPANYLEAPNLATFSTPIAASNNFNGASAFNVNNPGADLLKCLP